MNRIRTTVLVGLLAGAGALAATPAGAQAGITHRPRVAVDGPGAPTSQLGWSSSNWSGYAKTGSGFSAATGSWVVQAVTGSRRASYSSQWVGIDGFNNSSLIQTGTESDFYNGSAHYGAWWEILPASETVISSITVRAGDHMSASVQRVSGSSWTITISDTTTGKSFSTTQNYTGPGTSAEWVEEAPTVGGRVATLANYGGPVTFDPGTVNGGNPGLQASDGGTMVQKGVTVSTPSNPDGDTDGFNMKYGSTQPAAPAS